jgi:hypothetical protein
MTTLKPMPSPNNTNHERLFVARIPKGRERQAQLALDSALTKRHTDDRQWHGQDEERDAELHEKLVEIIDRHMDGDGATEALRAIDECFGGKTYGDSPRHGDDEEEPDDDRREHLAEYLRDRGVDDGIIDQLVESMPHSGMHGMGGRVRETDDRRRAVRDRRDRRMAHDAAARASFEQFYPWAARIRPAL